jgi:hypothetical protein
MEEPMIQIRARDFEKLVFDVALIKKMLMTQSICLVKDDEGELSDWAKDALSEARMDKRTFSSDEVRKKLLAK